MLSARDPVRRRQPIERPLDIVALELLVSVSQALLAGILLSLAAQLGGDARAYGLPIPGLLAVLGIAVGVGWLRWLMGGSGWVMASVCLALAILAGALWLLALQDSTLPRIDPLVGLIAVACASYGLVAGVFLDGPHRAHWKGGVSEPHRGVPQTRATPARFSPPVQKVVDERLTDVHLPRVSLPSAPRLAVPTIKRATGADRPVPGSPAGEGLAPAEVVEPHVAAPSATEGVAVREVVATEVVERPAGAAASVGATNEAVEATEAVEASVAVEAAEADPDAPTQPVARPVAEWPRPIEPRGHTAAHRVDPPA